MSKVTYLCSTCNKIIYVMNDNHPDGDVEITSVCFKCTLGELHS